MSTSLRTLRPLNGQHVSRTLITPNSLWRFFGVYSGRRRIFSLSNRWETASQFNASSPTTTSFSTSASAYANTRLKPVDLKYTQYLPPDGGNQTREAIVFLHSLFGSKRNWHSVANALSNELNRPVYALDLRNHGESPHAKPMTYPQMALDVTHFIQKHNLERISLVGHSMGGKVAMTTVLGRYLPPSTIANLVVADIAPIKGKVSRASVSYFEAMKKIESMKLKTKKEARNVLAEWEKNPGTQAFLLTNLIVPSDPSSLQEYAKFGIPLDILSGAVPDIGIFPYEPGEVEPWTGRTLFVKGGKSKFLNEDAIGVARKLFPSMELEVLDAGHYVHGERPNEFKQLIVDFIKAEMA